MAVRHTADNTTAPVPEEADQDVNTAPDVIPENTTPTRETAPTSSEIANANWSPAWPKHRQAKTQKRQNAFKQLKLAVKILKKLATKTFAVRKPGAESLHITRRPPSKITQGQDHLMMTNTKTQHTPGKDNPGHTSRQIDQ